MTTISGSVDASGKVIESRDGIVVFQPAGTNYKLHLVVPNYSGQIGVPVRGSIVVKARKIYTIPSGGNFMAPILGTPRIIQGRVRALDQQTMVVQAGAMILVEFPEDDSAFDLARGPISVGALVNVVARPGARLELR